MWIDSHAHLTMFGYDEIGAVLRRATTAGVGGILVPATNAEDLDRTLELAAGYPDRIVAAVGVHPHDASSLNAGLKATLGRVVGRDGVVAIGEIGLDYHYLHSPREDQLAALRWQIGLARETELPVVLHNRESWSDLSGLLAEHAGDLRGVCHSFTEGPVEARQVVDWGLWVGISGMVTFKRGDNIRDMARALSPDRVLVETDSPFLAPVPYRGKRNEPAYVVHVAESLARVLGVSSAELAAATGTSFRRLFGVSGTWPASGSASSS